MGRAPGGGDMKWAIVAVFAAALCLASAEDHGVQLLDDAGAAAHKDSDEVTHLKLEVQTIKAKTEADMRAKLNEQKESYFKKMKKASSFAGKLELATARAAAQVAEVTEENGKYKAMVQVLKKKAAYGEGLRRTVTQLQKKVVASVEAVAELESQKDKAKKGAKDAKKAKRNPADVALIAKLQAELEKKNKPSKADQAKAEKAQAKAAHKKAGKLHKKAKGEHAKEGDDKAAKQADKDAAKSDKAAAAVDGPAP